MGFFERLLSPEIVWVLIPLTALSIPIVLHIVAPIKERMAVAERREARQMYERLAKEKLDLLKTAVTMGYNRDDMADLDARLERLIGSDKLGKLLSVNPKQMAAAELATAEVAEEIAWQRQRKSER